MMSMAKPSILVWPDFQNTAEMEKRPSSAIRLAGMRSNACMKAWLLLQRKSIAILGRAVMGGSLQSVCIGKSDNRPFTQQHSQASGQIISRICLRCYFGCAAQGRVRLDGGDEPAVPVRHSQYLYRLFMA